MLEMASVDSQCVAIGDSLFQRDGDSDEGRATTVLDRPERTDSRSLPVLQPLGCLASVPGRDELRIAGVSRWQ
jgi:hypothetical protein